MEEIKNFIDQIHMPEDAGEYEEDLLEILQRIPENWGRWISCDKGWYSLIVKTHNKLKFIDPNYEIHQIKEKFGELRYYYQSSYPIYSSVEGSIMQDIVFSAEEQSSRICEVCGSNSKSKTRSRRGWLKTLCVNCATELEYEVDSV